MAYNPYYPATYPYQTMMPQIPQVQQSQPQSGIIWVQGIEAMKSYPVAAGQSVLLMDSESNCFGIKTADASGMPLPLRLFDYAERTSVRTPESTPAPSFDASAYITRDEFESRLAALSAPVTVKAKSKKEGEQNAE